MKKTSFAKHMLVWLLALALIVGIAPAINLTEAFAAEEKPIIVIAGSDYQSYKEVGGSKVSDNSAGEKQVKKLLGAIQKDHYDVDGFIFVGDYDYATVDEVGPTKAGLQSLQKAFRYMYGNGVDEIYIQGNHDPDSMVDDGYLAASGNNDTDNYGVFVINEMDYDWGGEDKKATQAIANELSDYLDDKIAEGYSKPIFIACHIPLHFSMRTYKADEGDGLYAYMIFNELNAAGAAGLDIIFMFGHNHSGGWDDYLGGGAIYLAKGDKINICQGNQQQWKVETLNFTYMNAGYVSYYRDVNKGAECDLTMTVFLIYEDKVVIKRYSEDGVHDLKSKGVRNDYAGSYFGPYWNTYETYKPDTKVYASPQTVLLTKKSSVDTSALEAAIATAESKKEADYTTESYATLQNALKAAKTVLAKSDPTQDEVDAAAKTLTAALSALAEYKPADKTALNKAISDAEALDAAQYTDSSYAAVESALKSAKTVQQKDRATQAEVDSAATALSNALKALEKKPVETNPTEPTEKPTEPTEKPTDPTEEPTEPTEEPTEPTEEPTEPTEEPVEPTEEPTEEPTAAPTEEPTEAPKNEETQAPTNAPAATDKGAEESKGGAGLIIGIVIAVVVIGAVAVVIIKKKK